MVDIAISSGHALRVRGARGPAPWGLDEVDENRRVTDRVVALLRSAGVRVVVFHDNTSTSISANLNTITSWHNGQRRDRDISIHFNAFQVTDNPRGTEVLHKTQATLAANVSRAMASAGRFINRGAKFRNDLSFLNRTTHPAILLEVCFVDSRADTTLYREHFEAICRSIAESISGAKIPGEPPPQVHPPHPAPPPIHPQEPTGKNIVDLTIGHTAGDAQVLINRDPINDTANTRDKLEVTLEHAGDVIVNVNGEDFQIPARPIPPSPVQRPTLRRGSLDVEDVRELQRQLNHHGATPRLNIDGAFGSITEAAVRAFQTRHGLVADGIVGPITWGRLLNP